MLGPRLFCAVLAHALALGFASPTSARADELCIALASRPEPRLILPAGGRLAQRQAQEIAITFVGHSTFLIETPKGIRIATDYNDHVRPAVLPHIATMNRAHTTHFSLAPDPSIAHVLKGWNPAGGAALHDVRLGDARVRSVPTNIRGGIDGTDTYGNSIFVIETADLCIAHLGHLHHTLTSRHLAQIGRVDIVLAPVDGSFTLYTPGMIEVLGQLKPRLVLPMHYFSPATLARFLDAASPHLGIQWRGSPTIVMSRARLPQRPTILVLPES